MKRLQLRIQEGFKLTRPKTAIQNFGKRLADKGKQQFGKNASNLYKETTDEIMKSPSIILPAQSDDPRRHSRNARLAKIFLSKRREEQSKEALKGAVKYGVGTRIQKHAGKIEAAGGVATAAGAAYVGHKIYKRRKKNGPRS